MSSTHLAPAPRGKRSGSGQANTYSVRDLGTRGSLVRNADDCILLPRVLL
jgi:hypothetical protein